MATDTRKRSGLAPLPTGLLRPTTPQPEPDPEPELELGADNGAGDLGRPAEAAADPEPATRAGEGPPAEARPAKARRQKRQAPTGESRGRKLVLPDEIHDRLWMTARQKKTTVSAVAAEILDRNLPRWRVEREG